jgi:serine/threonine protein kinase
MHNVIYKKGKYGIVTLTPTSAIKKFILHNITYGVQQSTIREMSVYTKCSGKYGVISGNFQNNKGDIELVMERGINTLRDKMNDLCYNQRKYIFFIILKDLCIGLWNIHMEGFVHRDIKPENILCFPNNKYKLIDFGLSRESGDKMTGIGYSGKLVYNDEKFTFKTDICQLGASMALFLTGKYLNLGDIKIKGKEGKIISKMININIEDRIGITELLIYLNLYPSYSKKHYIYIKSSCSISKEDVIKVMKKFDTLVNPKSITHTICLMNIVYEHFKSMYKWHIVLFACIMISSKLFDETTYITQFNLSNDKSDYIKILKVERLVLLYVNYKIPINNKLLYK